MAHWWVKLSLTHSVNELGVGRHYGLECSVNVSEGKREIKRERKLPLSQ